MKPTTVSYNITLIIIFVKFILPNFFMNKIRFFCPVSLVNNRNSLQRSSRTNVSTNLPETQQPSPGYRQPAATMATAPTVTQQPQQQHAYSSSNPAVLPTVTVYADKAKSIITDAVKKQAVTNMGYLLDINRARMNNPLLK